MKILDYLILTIITACLIYGSYSYGYNSSPEPASPYFWIDNNRFHIDSTLDCSPIYNDIAEQIGVYIRVTHGQDSIYIECMDEKGYTWEEWQESFILAFKEAAE